MRPVAGLKPASSGRSTSFKWPATSPSGVFVRSQRPRPSPWRGPARDAARKSPRADSAATMTSRHSPRTQPARQHVRQLVRKLFLELPVGVGMCLDGGAARPNRGVAPALPVRHDLVGRGMIAVKDASLDLMQPLARAVILQNAGSRAVGDQDPGSGGFHGNLSACALMLSVAIRFGGAACDRH